MAAGQSWMLSYGHFCNMVSISVIISEFQNSVWHTVHKKYTSVTSTHDALTTYFQQHACILSTAQYIRSTLQCKAFCMFVCVLQNFPLIAHTAAIQCLQCFVGYRPVDSLENNAYYLYKRKSRFPSQWTSNAKLGNQFKQSKLVVKTGCWSV